MKRRKPYYEALGVPKDALPAEVRRAYRALAKRLHPDRHLDPEHARHAEEQLKEINAAWTEYLALTKRGSNRHAAPRRSQRAEDDEDFVSSGDGPAHWAPGRSARTTRDRYRAERAGAARDREERERRAREAAERVRIERLHIHFERRAQEHARLLRISRLTMAALAGLCITLVVVILLPLATS